MAVQANSYRFPFTIPLTIIIPVLPVKNDEIRNKNYCEYIVF